MTRAPFTTAASLLVLCGSSLAQNHSTPIARRPHDFQVARVNSDQGSISVVNPKLGTVFDLDPGPGISRTVGEDPRTLAWSDDGSKLYVVNKRGEGGTFPNSVFGSVYVLDALSGFTVSKVITDGIEVEPFGIAVSDDGGFAAVTNFQSSSVSFIDTATDTVSFVFHYVWDPNLPGVTQSQVDPDLDGIPNHGKPRGIALTGNGNAAWVTHFLSGHVTKLALTRETPTGKVIGATLAKDLDLNRYTIPVDGLGKPVFITANASQGVSRFLESITIEPGGERAWVPHVLSNFMVKVEETRFSVDNQAYPAVSIIDLVSETFEWGLPAKTDNSDRIQFDTSLPIGQSRSHGVGTPGTGGFVPLIDVMSDAIPGAFVAIRFEDVRGAAPGILAIGTGVGSIPLMGSSLFTVPLLATLPIQVGGAAGQGGAGVLAMGGSLPSNPTLAGVVISLQGIFADPAGKNGLALSNAGVVEIGQPSLTIPPSTFGRRVAQPVQVEFTPDGSKALVVSWASEDVAVFDVTGSAPQFQSVFPPRNFNRVPFDSGKPIGENPNGLTTIPSESSGVHVYINNATSHDLSLLFLALPTGAIAQTLPRISLVTDDDFSIAERAGRELFNDATRSQTASNMNGSCSECHFDGAVDGLTWHFGEGPRQTISLAGGPLTFGLMFWKSKASSMKTFEGGFRIHQGGAGNLDPADLAGLTLWGNGKVPLAINPRLVAPLTDAEKRGRDLYFGTNLFGQNPQLRSANCAECHPDGLFTVDELSFPSDPCKSLESQFAHLQNVNSQDEDGQLTDDADMSVTEGGCSQPGGSPTQFFRAKGEFGVPSKLSVFDSAPYFHHGRMLNLRSLIDPASQTAGPDLTPIKNTAHDLRGFVVSFTLLTSPTEQDIDDVLAFISRL